MEPTTVYTVPGPDRTLMGLFARIVGLHEVADGATVSEAAGVDVSVIVGLLWATTTEAVAVRSWLTNPGATSSVTDGKLQLMIASQSARRERNLRLMFIRPSH
jgi:hypothetical protein